MARPRVTHYAGEILCRWGKEGSTHILPGWAACCSGDRAEKIRRDKAHTYDRTKVTCKPCLAMLAKRDAYEREDAS